MRVKVVNTIYSPDLEFGEELLDGIDADLVNGRWLDEELRNQEERIADISRWQKMYRGQREAKDTPYPGCSNVAVPISRINTEAISVRVIDGFWSQPKFWVVQPKKEEFEEIIHLELIF